VPSASVEGLGVGSQGQVDLDGVPGGPPEDRGTASPPFSAPKAVRSAEPSLIEPRFGPSLSTSAVLTRRDRRLVRTSAPGSPRTSPRSAANLSSFGKSSRLPAAPGGPPQAMSGFGRMIRVGNGLAISFLVSGDGRPETWIWTVRRQAAPGPGGLIDKGASGLRLRRRSAAQARLHRARRPRRPGTPGRWRHPVPQRHGHHAR
jgi:hypothetical protein